MVRVIGRWIFARAPLDETADRTDSSGRKCGQENAMSQRFCLSADSAVFGTSLTNSLTTLAMPSQVIGLFFTTHLLT